MEVLSLFLILLGLSFILSEFFESKRIPKFLGPLLVGIIFGLPLLKPLIVDSLDFIKVFADLGLLFLMFYTGLQIDLNVFRKKNHEPIVHGFLTFLLPFVLGFFTTLYFGFPLIVALIVGIALSVTSEAIAVSILEEFNLKRRKIGRTVLASGLVDDIIGIVLLSVIVSFITFSNELMSLGFFFLEILAFIIVLIITRFLLIPKLLKFVNNKSESELLASMILLAVLMALAADYLGLSSIIGAVIAGILIRHVLNLTRKHYEEAKIEKLIRIVSFEFLTVFFYIWVGFHADFSLINPLLAISLIIIAFLGKILGSTISGFFYKRSFKFSHLVGWGLSPRGALELAILEIARQFNLIPLELYSAIVFMAVTTIVISPLVFTFLIRKNHALLKDKF